MSDAPLPSAAQIRAARAMLGWSQTELAERAGIARRTLTSVEMGHPRVTPESVEALQHVLEQSGLKFIGSGGPTEGVRRNE